MTDRRAHTWGAAIVAAGGVLGLAGALWAGRPGLLWRPLVFGLAAYVASGAVVLRWGLAVYGPRGALGALAAVAFAPGVLAALAAPPLLAPAGGTTLLGGFAQLAATYALARDLLDPTLQWTFLASGAILLVPIGAFLQGSTAVPTAGMAVLSLLLVAARVATAERWEGRVRVARASAVAVGLAWTAVLAVSLLVAAASHLPSPEEYSSARPAPSARRFNAVLPVRAAEAAGADAAATPAPRPAGAAALPLAALLLAAARPWRSQRRYSDIAWIAALLCLGAPLWLAWGESGGVFMAPFAALLAGGCWDSSRPAWARAAASAVVALQVAAAVLLWPHYPGGVRADAWLPMPGISDAVEAP